MGARGPAPEPTDMGIAKGSWRAKARAKNGEVRFTVATPTCPVILHGEAKAEWNRQIKELEAVGVLQLPDRAILAAWCEAWGEFVELLKAIHAKIESAEVMGFDRAYLHAQPGYKEMVKSKNAAVERMLKLSQQFGFTPSARTRIRGEEPEQVDPLEAFINGGRSA